MYTTDGVKIQFKIFIKKISNIIRETSDPFQMKKIAL